MTPATPKYVTGAIVSPNGGLKAAPPPPQKQNSEHTRGELNGLVVYVDVRIGLTLYSSSCKMLVTDLTCCSEGRKKCLLDKNKMLAKKMIRKDTTYRGHQRDSVVSLIIRTPHQR
jgi:hypothetical protein